MVKLTKNELRLIAGNRGIRKKFFKFLNMFVLLKIYLKIDLKKS